jgi:hypothetical protein
VPTHQDDSDAVEVQSGRGLVQLGAESLAGLGGAAAGAFLGPVGALAGAAAGPSVVTALGWAGRTIKTRMLSSNEEVRIGTALYVALERLTEREQAGDEPRVDGMFEPAPIRVVRWREFYGQRLGATTKRRSHSSAPSTLRLSSTKMFPSRKRTSRLRCWIV